VISEADLRTSGELPAAIQHHLQLGAERALHSPTAATARS
jgi:hypothetical protein